MRTEMMAVLPPVPAGACLLLSVVACCPALLRAWRNPSPKVFASGVVSAAVLLKGCFVAVRGSVACGFLA